MKTRTLLLWACSAVSISACANVPVNEESRPVAEGEEGAIGRVDDGLYVRVDRLWKDTQWPVRIPVCWEDGAFADEQAIVQQAVESAWEATGDVDFTGWGSCNDASRGLRVRMQDAGGFTWGLGSDLDGTRSGVNLNTWGSDASPRICAATFTRAQCVQSTAVHEFGHALGFPHEHNRDDNRNGVADHLEGGGTCTSAPQGSCRPDAPCDDALSFGAWDVNSVMNYCNPVRNGDGQLSDVDTAGLRAMYGRPWIENFGNVAGGWRTDRHPRLLGDVDGDGRDDIVGFGTAGVSLALSNGTAYVSRGRVLDVFGYDAGGWRFENHPRMLGDVNGDGRADIVGFGNAGVYLATSTGTGFAYHGLVFSGFGYEAGGWRTDKHPRMLADVNGDGRADIVGFGNAGVYLATSTGTGFAYHGLVLDNFGYEASGWRIDRHPRMLGDVNGDGRADIVGFGNAGVYLATSTGTGFTNRGLALDGFGYEAGGWRTEKNPRMLGDVNGDGRSDIVGFGNDGVFLALGNGTGFRYVGRVFDNLAYDAGGWRVERHPRFVADVNGDGRDDLIGHGTSWTYVALSTGEDFQSDGIWSMGYSYNDGFTVENHVRLMGDVDGDGIKDIVGFKDEGVKVHPLVTHIEQTY